MLCCVLRTTLAAKQYNILYCRGRLKTCVYGLPLIPRVVYSTRRSPTNFPGFVHEYPTYQNKDVSVFENRKVQCGFSRGAGRFWWENLKETRFEHRGVWWQGNIKMNLRNMKSEVVDEINLRIETSGAQLSIKKAGNSVIGRGAVRVSRMTVPHGISSGFASVSAPWPYLMSRRVKLLTWKVAHRVAHDYRRVLSVLQYMWAYFEEILKKLE